MDSTGNVLLAAAAGGQSRPHGRLRGRTPPSARSPPPGPAPWLEGLPVPPPAAQKSHARRAQGTPRAAATAGVRCWALGVQGCRRPSPDASPTFTHSRVPRRQPGREAGSGNARAQCVSLWERHRNSRRKERNGKGPAARRQLSREAAALARAGQGARSQRPGHSGWAGGARQSPRAPLHRQRPLTSRPRRSRPSLPCGWGQGRPQPTASGHRVAPVLGVLGLLASPWEASGPPGRTGQGAQLLGRPHGARSAAVGARPRPPGPTGAPAAGQDAAAPVVGTRLGLSTDAHSAPPRPPTPPWSPGRVQV